MQVADAFCSENLQLAWYPPTLSALWAVGHSSGARFASQRELARRPLACTAQVPIASQVSIRDVALQRILYPQMHASRAEEAIPILERFAVRVRRHNFTRTHNLPLNLRCNRLFVVLKRLCLHGGDREQ